jgi:hypothetical protein
MKLTLTFCLLACAVIANGGAVPLKTDLFIGCCDASAAVALTDDLFVIADDEDNVFRIYSRARMGRPVSTVDLTGFLNPGKKAPEVDIEASARIGDRIYWISSHGRNAKGKAREARHRFFATSVGVTNGTVQLQPAGNFYAKLLDDLARDPRLSRYGLAKASFFAPKAQGALNIEGMAPTREGHLIIGFRNPIPDGKALLVRLLNPQDLLTGGKPQFGAPILLDLQGLGVRGIEFWRDRYLIIGGARDGTAGSRLFEWNGTDVRVSPLQTPDLRSINPEAMTVYGPGDSEQLLMVSDDGTLQIRGEECKKLKDPTMKRFRVVSLPLNQLIGNTSTAQVSR